MRTLSKWEEEKAARMVEKAFTTPRPPLRQRLADGLTILIVLLVLLIFRGWREKATEE